MSNERTIAKGDTVYSQHGQEAEFVAATGGEYIVRPIYEDDDGPRAGDVETWREVFRTPPAPKLDADTAAAQKRLDELNAQCAAKRKELSDFEREERERRERLKLHEELADLDRYLNGEITHYVAKHNYSDTISIIPVGETMESYGDSYERGMLRLWPSKGFKNDGSLRWAVSYRPRESRDTFTYGVIPCCGLEEATAKAQEILRGQVEKMMALEPAKRHSIDSLIRNCNQYRVEVPDELLNTQADKLREMLEKERAELHTKLANVEMRLSAVPA